MNELYVKGNVYFRTDTTDYNVAVDELFEALEATGVEIDFIKSELRDDDENVNDPQNNWWCHEDVMAESEEDAIERVKDSVRMIGSVKESNQDIIIDVTEDNRFSGLAKFHNFSADPFLSNNEIKSRVLKAMSGYKKKDFDLFIAEYGYDENWMWQFSDAELDEEMPENDIEKINSVLKEIWDEHWNGIDEYYIKYNTGAGNIIITGTLEEAQTEADSSAAYTQKNIDICDSDGEIVATRRWYGVAPDEEDECGDIIRFGDSGFYDEWEVE